MGRISEVKLQDEFGWLCETCPHMDCIYTYISHCHHVLEGAGIDDRTPLYDGADLRNYKNGEGITSTRLAQMLGVSLPTVSLLLHNRYRPSAELAARISALLKD